MMSFLGSQMRMMPPFYSPKNKVIPYPPSQPTCPFPAPLPKKDKIRDGPLEKLWGGGEFSSRRNFFSLSNSLHEFFLGHSMNIFLGLIGVHEFFSFNFPLRDYFFFGTSPPPPHPPHKFSNGPPLSLSPWSPKFDSNFFPGPLGC